ncbi:putative exported protein [Piscinibacter sakaiensis]|uniref:Putative exported protein n=1 Tax=Piscinibacter sakaiensis TaxID=1547922 RepID=A0A0K8P2D7_PISS1|nr:putative exported protein [Piscinibacter sakaiensis]
MLKGIAIGGVAAVVLGAGAVTGYRTVAQPREAQVVAVRDVLQTVTTPQERCDNVQVTHRAPTQDPNRITGSVIGGIAGGLLGNQIGGGSGRTLATVAGAAAGGYAGNQVQKNMQQRDTVTTTERRCKTVQTKSQQLVGYDVTYRIGEREGVVRTSFKPGATLPVKDGQVVVDAPAVPVSTAPAG